MRKLSISLAAIVLLLAAGAGCGASESAKEASAGDPMATNRAKATCEEFKTFLEKNRAGTSKIEDALKIQETLAIAAETAAEPVKAAAAGQVAVFREDNAGADRLQAQAEVVKDACQEFGVKIPKGSGK